MDSKASYEPAVKGEHVVVATRIHLGKATSPPSDLATKLQKFQDFSRGYEHAIPVIAVDATNRIPGYNLLEQVQLLLTREPSPQHPPIRILPIQPWNNFTPALNALLHFATAQQPAVSAILFCSVETTAPASTTLPLLLSHLDPATTLVVGAVLPGHAYSPGQPQPLTGRTCPWNTLAMWNVPKLARTGFQLVSETSTDAGIEEVAAVAVQQVLFGRDQTKAKLISVEGVEWDTTSWAADPARIEWHRRKMESKNTRAASQLQRLELDQEDARLGVEHI